MAQKAGRHDGRMTETLENHNPTDAPIRQHRPNRLNQIAAWVGIVAGVVFITAAIFTAGFVVGKGASDAHGVRYLPLHGTPGPWPMGPPPMGPPPMGPPPMGPGMGPGMGPSVLPLEPAPASPAPRS